MRTRGYWNSFPLQWEHPTTFQDGVKLCRNWNYMMQPPGVVTNWCQWPRRSLQVLCHHMCTLPLLVLCHLPFPPSCYLGILLPLLKVRHFQTGFPLLFSWENDKEEAIFYISSSHSPLHTHIFPAHFSWPHQCVWWDDGKTTQTRSGLAHKRGIFKFPMPSMVWSV